MTYHDLEIHKKARGAVEELWGKPALLPAAVPNCIALGTKACSDGGWPPSNTTTRHIWPALVLSTDEGPGGGYVSQGHSHRTGPTHAFIFHAETQAALIGSDPLGSWQYKQLCGHGQVCETMSQR